MYIKKMILKRLQGILYDRGYSCSIHSTSPLKTEKINRIALVKYGGDCDFYQKVYNSQLDGADGVIIYNEIPFEKNLNSGIEVIMCDGFFNKHGLYIQFLFRKQKKET